MTAVRQYEIALAWHRYLADRPLCRLVLARHASAQGRELVWGMR